MSRGLYDKVNKVLIPTAGIGPDITVDSALSSTSVNPVENRVITNALDDKQDVLTIDSTPTSGSTNVVQSGGVYTALADKVDTSLIGVADGVAELDSTGKVPDSQLPSYEDVVEGYYNELDGKFYAEDTFQTEIEGEANKIYIDLPNNTTYRWDETGFIQIGSGLALGETSTTAYRGDRGKTAYEFSQAPYTSDPAMNGTASAGVSDAWARGDHVHPSDSSKQDVLEFDVAPTSGSTNVVNSGAVYTALQSKQDTIDPDTAPTSGSTNVVTSGGVYTALDNKQSAALSSTVAIGSTVAETVEGAISNVAEIIPAIASTANLLATNSDLPEIDNALSATSANPVENRVVKQAVDAKADSATTLAGYNISDAYTKSEVDNKISEVVTSMTWKPAVATYTDIATTYPNPQEGWTVVTTDTNIAWRYSDGAWIEISANTIPLATTSVDGLLSSTLFTKLNGIEAGAQVNQNAFDSFKIGSDVIVANATTSTLELIEGDNVIITPDTTNDTITIAAANTTYAVETAASGSTVESLVTAGEKHTWNNKQDALEYDVAPASGSTKIVNSGTVYTALSDKQDVLEWDTEPTSGSTNAVDSGAVFDALPVEMVGASSEDDGAAGLVPTPTSADRNKFLRGDGTWFDVSGGASVAELSDIGDVQITNVQNGQSIKWDSATSKWVNADAGEAYSAGFGIAINNGEISSTQFVGTQAEWNALSSTQQAAFDFINITDDTTYVEEGAPGHAISNESGGLAQREGLKFEGFTVTDDSTNNQTKVTAIPYTAGDGIEIDANKEVTTDPDLLPFTFVGTTAEWNDLSATEKAKYSLVNLTDDIAGGDMVVVDTVADGNMNPVTSNAVYDYVDAMITSALNEGY